MGDELLAENNSCGQALLQLVSRGNAVIAELLRLKDYIPPEFEMESSERDESKYLKVIYDFKYFDNPSEIEKLIESNPVLSDLDTIIRENHIELLTRFYLAFESIQKFVSDTNQYVEDLDEGVYIGQSLDSVFVNEDGRQLLCEAIYLYGVMLMVVEHHIPEFTRERLIISYYRYSAQRSSAGSNVEDVCRLLRCTGSSRLRPPNYPDELFSRSPPDPRLVDSVIGWLRSDDLYNQIAAYPFAEQRTTALAAQAAMLYVCLFFRPATLASQPTTMRNIVDKYFPDNWVVSVYMGMTVNLVEAWEPYKAAKSALANTLLPDNIKEQCTYHANKLENLLTQSTQLLKEGMLVQESILDQVNSLINLIRDCNVTLRWLMLHTSIHPNDKLDHCSGVKTSEKCKQIRERVLAEIKHPPEMIFKLLLNTAELELKVKDVFKVILSEREEKWVIYRQQSEERMRELADVFTGTRPLTRVDKNENLQTWFKNVGNQISSLNVEEPAISSRKIVRLIQALSEVQGFHQLNRNLQVQQFIEDTRSDLNQMVKGLKVTEGVLINLQIVGDISYAWHLIDGYTLFMQNGIQKDPSMIAKLRATFLKLSSAMEIPLLRINQANSLDLVSVSQYYSNELVNYVRKVLHIIPKSMFNLMAKIVELQTSVIQELPTRLEKDKLKQYAQLDARNEVAKLTHLVSVFTEGILRMKSTLVGIVTIDPKQLLEDGVRKELVNHIAVALHEGLVFRDSPKPSTGGLVDRVTPGKPSLPLGHWDRVPNKRRLSLRDLQKLQASDFVEKLYNLGKIMDGHRRSFEYIQDYIGMNGLKIWQEELSRVIGFNVDMECNNYLSVKVMQWQSIHQSKAIPVPLFPPLKGDSMSTTFVGRLAKELISITNPRKTIYLTKTAAWYSKNLDKFVDMITFTRLTSAIGVSGVTGLDRLLSFIIVSELQNFLKTLQRGILKEKAWIDFFGNVCKGLGSSDQILANPSRTYIQACNKASKIWTTILKTVLNVGQIQLLRRHIFFELRTSCKFEAKNLSSALENMNQALLNEIRGHYKDPASKPYPSEDSQLLLEVATYLDWSGISNPLTKIYVTTKNPQFFSLLMFLFVIAEMNHLEYSKKHCTLLWKKHGDPKDGMPFVVGVATMFRQFHPEIRSQFLLYMAQYIKSHLTHAVTTPPKLDIPCEVFNNLYFLIMFADVLDIPHTELWEYIPEAVFNLFPKFSPYQSLKEEKTTLY